VGWTLSSEADTCTGRPMSTVGRTSSSDDRMITGKPISTASLGVHAVPLEETLEERALTGLARAPRLGRKGIWFEEELRGRKLEKPRDLRLILEPLVQRFVLLEATGKMGFLR